MHLSNNEIVCIGQVQLLFPEMFWPDILATRVKTMLLLLPTMAYPASHLALDYNVQCFPSSIMVMFCCIGWKTENLKNTIVP